MDGYWVRIYIRLDSQNPLGVAQASISGLTQVSCDETELSIPLDVALSMVGKVSRPLKKDGKHKALVDLNRMCAKVGHKLTIDVKKWSYPFSMAENANLHLILEGGLGSWKDNNNDLQ